METVRGSRAAKTLIGVVIAGAVIIATIGFVGSYTAVRDLAEQKGFGAFSPFFPLGIDAGILVLLALDLLLTWLRMPFPLLRQTAWLLTAATIAFNGAAAWGDPLGVGMHAIIPVLFVITVEAARHAIGRVADITADKHMEGVRMWRWLLSPIPTFRLWRRMKLWELRSYDEVITMERDRLVYQTRLRAEYGRAWRRRAPVEELMPLKLARFGVPLPETDAPTVALDREPTAAVPDPSASPQPLPSADESPLPTEEALRLQEQDREAADSRNGQPTAAAWPPDGGEFSWLVADPQPSVPEETDLVVVTDVALEPDEVPAQPDDRQQQPVFSAVPAPRQRAQAWVDGPPSKAAADGQTDTLDRVTELFRALSAQDRQLSNQQLAGRWAQELGLSVDRIRKRYLPAARAAVEKEETERVVAEP
ncbi:DUF2637 domain-containing protein [Streptomyces sp. G-5]|uniref:DUF2637 domain-containing protein n=1 Tax=Streptomyces sp. G-5 TaxID=2977231 RepID=UPI0021D38F31|nr:DUF2637 domain-containing protein [Streptomyces sp. G-5]MCU4750287.1 DUF2637 domain-containing protein [Streptomyces sp. G-5]